MPTEESTFDFAAPSVLTCCGWLPSDTDFLLRTFVPLQVGKGKEGCGRVVMRKQLGIVNAYTMEASFMGADQVVL